MLKQTFLDLVQKYTVDPRLADSMWYEIERSYSGTDRYYHTLAHLENLLNQLNEVKEQVADWDSLLFSLYYHDIIYTITGNDSEEKSAEFAWDRLQQLSFPPARISKCFTHIISTRGHAKSKDNDTNLFTDADLSILGTDWKTYSAYCRQIRREYSLYRDDVYVPGRKKVLKHFLDMEKIFKTKYFFDKFEVKARENLAMELKELG